MRGADFRDKVDKKERTGKAQMVEAAASVQREAGQGYEITFRTLICSNCKKE